MGICATVDAVNMDEVDLSHFQILSTVGKGGFGKVKAAQDKKDPPAEYDDTNQRSMYLALKLQDLRELTRKESHWKAAWVERNVMSQVDSPFVVRLHYAFLSHLDLVFVMPFLRGGDLNFYLTQVGPMPEAMAKFYVGEIALGMAAIHKLDYVYRDLKPENCLLDAFGHVYISDLGLATQLSARDKRYKNELFSDRYKPPHHMRTRGCCGTPGYVAPEVINRHSYGFMPDMFTLGCTLVKLLTRRSPFSPKLMDLSKVTPSDFPTPRVPGSAECQDFVRSLTEFREEKRLGFNGFWEEVKRHAWFRDDEVWDWKRVAAKAVTPPHKPSLKRLNFNPVYEAEEQIMAEGRKPMDRAEREKIQKVFDGIAYNTVRPFKDSKGDLWPKTKYKSRLSFLSKSQREIKSTPADSGGTAQPTGDQPRRESARSASVSDRKGSSDEHIEATSPNELRTPEVAAGSGSHASPGLQ